MGTTYNSGILFRISGVALGEYIFEQNPEEMDLQTPKQYYSKLDLLEGENIFQRSLNDNEIRKMNWSITNSGLYSTLKQYSTRTLSGTIPQSYFWDGIVNEFQGVQIEVIDVHGVPIAGDYDKWKVELQFKPITYFDNKKILI